MSGAALAVREVSLRLGSFVLRDLNLALDAGETLVMLGPNGAGKSVSLEAIAGFHRLGRGRIEIAGREVTRLPPERRRVSLMFQNFGLFPHLTVAQNAGFGRRERRDPGDLLERFRIADLARRYPQDLSPGERQRVALARAFAARSDLFLFDEPFSAIDAPTRERLREELRAFLREARAPAVFVTHDRTDASALADKIAILDRGEILQIGTAEAVMDRPATAAVARFLGIENILPGQSEGTARARLGSAVLRADSAGPAAGAIAVCIRAEDVYLQAPDRAASDRAENRLPARVEAITDLGGLRRVRLDCGFPLIADLGKRDARGLDLAPGRLVTAEIDPEAVHILAAEAAAPVADPRLVACAQQRPTHSGLTALLPWRRRQAIANADGELG